MVSFTLDTSIMLGSIETLTFPDFNLLLLVLQMLPVLFTASAGTPIRQLMGILKISLRKTLLNLWTPIIKPLPTRMDE